MGKYKKEGASRRTSGEIKPSRRTKCGDAPPATTWNVETVDKEDVAPWRRSYNTRGGGDAGWVGRSMTEIEREEGAARVIVV